MITTFGQIRRWLTLSALAIGLSLGARHAARGTAELPTFPAEQVQFYEKQVLPILKENCFKCHTGKKVRGGLHLDSRAGVLKGGDLGPAVLLAKPEQSPLLKAIHFKDGLEMPPSGKLPAEKIAVLERWVRMGLPFAPGKEVVKTPEKKHETISAEDRNYWAYRPVKKPAVPRVADTAWSRNPIDTFLLARLEGRGLRPNPPADRVALIRRATYDLTGLPPTPEEVDAFVADRSSDAYERLVDRLLASPAYGEKWGRHWLDLVRFAETNGYERDGPKPFAWRFRDYVIRSFNADKPYDRFIREQLAGDEIAPDDADAIIATGYYRLGLWDDEPVDRKQARADEIDDWVSTTSQVFLGMTINCARCHEHKRDPIPQVDYYRLAAFFEDVRPYSNSRDPRSAANLTDISPREERARYQDRLKQREIRLADLEAAMRKIENEAIRKMPAEDQRASEGPERSRVLRKVEAFLAPDQLKEYRKMRSERTALRKQPFPGARDLALSVNNCLPRPPQTHVLVRGNAHALGPAVTPGYPAVLGFPDPKIPEPAREARSSGRRTALAAWMASKDNPLTARVLVNRVWQYHFGRGIVPTANDFGKLGEMPTHPELLDWLAHDLAESGWHLKRLHRLILTSSAYQMSSRASAEGLARDPANTLLWRFGMRRLAAEEVRDAILAVSGAVNRRMEGPGIYPTIPREVLAGQSRPGEGWGRSSPSEQARRSIYVHQKRSLLVPILANHDQADTDSSCAVRYTTTVPTQALGMLNGDFTNEQAAAFAERLRSEAGDLPAQVHRAIRLTTGRQPGADEVKRDVAFIQDLQAGGARDAGSALSLYCLLALNANEFLYLD